MGEQLATELFEQLSTLPEDWLVGYSHQDFLQKTQQKFHDFTQVSNLKMPSRLLLAERDPLQFLTSFTAACAANLQIFLGNPNWGEQEWQQIFDYVQPDIILGQEAACYQKKSSLSVSPHQLPFIQSPYIMIPTGGSSGKLRFAIHTWETLAASVQGFKNYFQLGSIHSFCVLPLYHVSGLMQFLRSFKTSGKLAICPFKSLELGEICEINPEYFFISLVPTQLQRLLQSSETATWLSRFQTVLLGGAPAWQELLEAARKRKIRLAPTYGMTETASQIATLKPEDFLAGHNNSGQVLPHAKIRIRSEDNQILDTDRTGLIEIEASSLTRGYYSDTLIFNLGTLLTDDIGFLDEKGYLNIVGRSSDKIITGGENVFPAEVEATIRATDLVADVCVIGLPDRFWGQVVTALYVPSDPNISPTMLQAAIEGKLSKFKLPKHWIAVESLPRNLQGKINREQVRQIATQAMGAV